MSTERDTQDPRQLGYHMPGEFTRHTCCWMAWPCRAGVWPDAAAAAREYANVANTIARFEPVKMLVPPGRQADVRALLANNVMVIEVPIDDSWTRDSGPNFLVNGDGELAGSTWTFNAWGGKYHPFDEDARMGSRILKLAGAREFASHLVAEGGAVTVDGEGTVITTESCIPNPNRNPALNRDEIEAEVCRALGAEKVIWIPGDPEDTETDGHVDGIAAFIEPGRVLLEVNPDVKSARYAIGRHNLAALRGQTDARGRELQIEFIHEGWDSYVNSYLANDAVIVPAFGCDRDAAAAETFRRLYPERSVVQVGIRQLPLGGGGIHCITQQQPAVV